MKFSRISHKPKLTAEQDAALDFFNEIYELRMQLAAFKNDNPFVVTASVNMLSRRLATMVDDEEYVDKRSAAQVGLEQAVADVYRTVPEDQRAEALRNIFLDQRFQRFLYEYLLKTSMPKVVRSIKSLAGSVDDAEQIALNALEDFMRDREKASVIKSLMSYDPSKGDLMGFIEGGLIQNAASKASQLYRQKRTELSLDNPLKDDSGATHGDNIIGQFDEPDVDTFADKAEDLMRLYADYMQDLQQRVQMAEGPEKLVLQTSLQDIMSPQKDVGGKLMRLKKLGEEITELNTDLPLATKKLTQIQTVLNYYQTKDPAQAQKFQGDFKQQQAEVAEIKANLQQLYSEFRDIEQFLYKMAHIEQEPEDVKTPDSLGGDLDAPAGVPQRPMPMPIGDDKKRKHNPRKVQLDARQTGLLEDKLNNVRTELTPWLYKAMDYPSDKKNLQQQSSKLFRSMHMHKGLNDPQDVMSVLSNDPQAKAKLPTEALFYNLATQATLFARDRQVFDRAYEPEELSGAEEKRRAIENFRTFIENAVKNDPVLAERHDEIQQNLNVWLDPSKEANVFRTFFEYIDWYTRAAAYEKARNEVVGGKPFEELDDSERQAVAQKVFSDLYEGGLRPMHIAKHRGGSKYEPRYGLKPDATGESYIPIMMDELYRIGHISHSRKRDVKQHNPALDGQYNEESWKQRGNYSPDGQAFRVPYAVAQLHEISNAEAQPSRYDFRVQTRKKMDPSGPVGTEEIMNQPPTMANTFAKLVRVALDLNRAGLIREASIVLSIVERNA